jgi:NADH:ubiquinone oxidoreductase subunit 6 (subunit J)
LSAPTVILLFLCIVFVAAALCVLLAKRLLWTISAIGAGSAAIAVIFFLFGARYAGAFELSVGAGLVSVLFIIGSSLVRRSQ